MACSRVRGSVDAAQAAKAHPVFRPHFGLPQRARVAKSAPPRDRSAGRSTGGSGGAVGGVFTVAIVGGMADAGSGRALGV
eukprot:4038754-Pleurochrysis_carterae.AAC.1